MVDARGLWFVAPGQVEWRTTDLAPLAPGELLVRTSYSGISSGTERLAYRGELDPNLPVDETIGALGGTFRYPFQYGYSCVGTVEESRTDVPVGTLVFAFQPHQNRFVAGAGDVVPMPGVDPRHATLFPLVETALQITLDAGEVFGEAVVVFGLGAVGLLTALLLRRAGAHPVAVEPLAWRRRAAEELGVRAVGGVGALDERGVPLVIEASGDPAVLAAALPLLRHEGTALVASWYGTKEVSLPLGQAFHRRRLTIRSTQVSTIPAALSGRWDRARRRQAAVDLLSELPLDAVATHTFPWTGAAEAFRAISDRPEGLIHAALWYE
jgi:2-desacetyl-2-hydroxyethyl bacteriochlorophyllide A dehydrogenase